MVDSNATSTHLLYKNNVRICDCIKDDEGLFVAARTEWFSPSTEADVGKALGLLTAINWIHEFRLDNMDFELYAKSIVDNMNEQQSNDSDFGVRNCNRLLVFLFKNSRVKFVRRQANEITHALARVAPSLANLHNFTGVPIYIQVFIINEMN